MPPTWRWRAELRCCWWSSARARPARPIRPCCRRSRRPAGRLRLGVAWGWTRRAEREALGRAGTEREGFEPSTEVASCNSLAGSRFQPLSHLSSGPASLSGLGRGLPGRGGSWVRGHGQPRQTVLEAAENLPGNRAAALAPVDGADRLPLLFPQQGDHAAHLDPVGVGGVDHELVHGDGPHLGQALPAEEHLHAVGELAGHPIGVADRDHRQSAGSAGAEAVAVADAHSGLHLAQQGDAGVDLQGRPQGHHSGQVGGGGVAVEGQAHPHQVVVLPVAAQGAGRIGEMTAAGRQALLRQAGQDRLEALLLEFAESVVLLGRGIGAGQVGVDAGQLDGVHALQGRHQPGAFLPVGAEAGHAGVELELHGHGAAAAAGQVLAEQGLAHAADGGHQLPAQTAAQFLGLGEVAEHQHWRPDAGAPQLHPFGEGGDTEAGRPGLQGGPGHRQGTVAVGIGLDHGHQLGGRTDVAPQRPHVGLDGRRVHLHPGPLPRLAGLLRRAGWGERGTGHGRGSGRKPMIRMGIPIACRLSSGLAWATFSF